MGAIKTKLESYKKPPQSSGRRGRAPNPSLGPSRSGGGKGNMMSMVRMALAQQRREQANEGSEILAESMAVRRQGTMESRVPRFVMMNELIARNDQMLESLLLDQ